MSLRSVFQSLVAVFLRYAAQDRGNLSLILGLSVVPVMICVGAAVDFERGVSARTQLQAAVDTAALYAAAYSANNTGVTNASLTALAKPYLTQNYTGAGDAAVTDFTVVDNGASITTNATIKLNTYFMAVGGYTSMTLNAASTVQKSGINLEVSLVLDNTTSMGWTNSKTGNPSITDLKAAAKKFITTVMPATQGNYYTKIAVVPYNNAVNMGSATLAAAARGSYQSGTSNNGPGKQYQQFKTNSMITGKIGYNTFGVTCDNGKTSNNPCQRTFPITNCVSERTGVLAYSDASLALSPTGPVYASSGNDCLVTPIVPLSTSASVLNATIDAMSAYGSTAGQVGIGWGWYALSPNIGIWSSPSIPADYDKLITTDATKKVRKVMVLMTDGEYNSAYYNGVITGNDTTNGIRWDSAFGFDQYYSVHGSGLPADHIGTAPSNGGSYDQSSKMCAAIKATGIEVYVITFQASNGGTAGQKLISDCATDSSHIIDADSTSLDAAFQSLANKILAMRISS